MACSGRPALLAGCSSPDLYRPEYELQEVHHLATATTVLVSGEVDSAPSSQTAVSVSPRTRRQLPVCKFATAVMCLMRCSLDFMLAQNPCCCHSCPLSCQCRSSLKGSVWHSSPSGQRPKGSCWTPCIQTVAIGLWIWPDGWGRSATKMSHAVYVEIGRAGGFWIC